MKWNEKRAKTIQKKYQLSDSTLRDWKSRNRIPDRYRGMKYVPPTPAKASDIKRMEKIFTHPFFVLPKKGAIPTYRLRDHLRGGGNALLRQEELDAFFQQVEEIKTVVQTFVDNPTEENFQLIRHEKRIRTAPLVDDTNLYYRIMKSYSIKPKEMRRLIKRAKVFLKVLNTSTG